MSYFRSFENAMRERAIWLWEPRGCRPNEQPYLELLSANRGCGWHECTPSDGAALTPRRARGFPFPQRGRLFDGSYCILKAECFFSNTQCTTAAPHYGNVHKHMLLLHRHRLLRISFRACNATNISTFLSQGCLSNNLIKPTGI